MPGVVEDYDALPFHGGEQPGLILILTDSCSRRAVTVVHLAGRRTLNLSFGPEDVLEHCQY